MDFLKSKKGAMVVFTGANGDTSMVIMEGRDNIIVVGGAQAEVEADGGLKLTNGADMYAAAKKYGYPHLFGVVGKHLDGYETYSRHNLTESEIVNVLQTAISAVV